MGSILTAQAAETLCLFVCGSRPYAMPIAAVAEIIDLGRLVRLPLAPRPLLGLTTYRGGIVPVVGTEDGGRPVADGAAPRTVILIVRSEHGPWGLAIERDGATVADRQAVRRFEAPATSGFLSLVGQVDRPGSAHTVIDPELSWQSLRALIDRWYRATSGAEAMPRPPTSLPGDRDPRAEDGNREEPSC